MATNQPLMPSSGQSKVNRVPMQNGVAGAASARESAKAALRAKAQQRRQRLGQETGTDVSTQNERYSRDAVESRGPESDSSPSPPVNHAPAGLSTRNASQEAASHAKQILVGSKSKHKE